MNTLLRFIETFLLVTMGTFMVWLAFSSSYWQFINPKYAWLTITAGAIIILIGIGALFHADRKRGFSEILMLTIFLSLAWAAAIMPNIFLGAETDGHSQGTLTRSYPEPGSLALTPTIEIDGVEYTKMNLAELIAGETGGWVKAGGKYAIQGTILRTPELDAVGCIALGRLLITCCFADATGITVLVKVDDPKSYEIGEWARVAGMLTPAAKVPEKPIVVTGALSSLRSDRYVLDAADVNIQSMPGVPFIFDIRSEAPFAY